MSGPGPPPRLPVSTLWWSQAAPLSWSPALRSLQSDAIGLITHWLYPENINQQISANSIAMRKLMRRYYDTIMNVSHASDARSKTWTMGPCLDLEKNNQKQQIPNSPVWFLKFYSTKGVNFKTLWSQIIKYFQQIYWSCDPTKSMFQTTSLLPIEHSSETLTITLLDWWRVVIFILMKIFFYKILITFFHSWVSNVFRCTKVKMPDI